MNSRDSSPAEDHIPRTRVPGVSPHPAVHVRAERGEVAAPCVDVPPLSQANLVGACCHEARAEPPTTSGAEESRSCGVSARVTDEVPRSSLALVHGGESQPAAHDVTNFCEVTARKGCFACPDAVRRARSSPRCDGLCEASNVRGDIRSSNFPVHRHKHPPPAQAVDCSTRHTPQPHKVRHQEHAESPTNLRVSRGAEPSSQPQAAPPSTLRGRSEFPRSASVPCQVHTRRRSEVGGSSEAAQPRGHSGGNALILPESGEPFVDKVPSGGWGSVVPWRDRVEAASWRDLCEQSCTFQVRDTGSLELSLTLTIDHPLDTLVNGGDE